MVMMKFGVCLWLAKLAGIKVERMHRCEIEETVAEREGKGEKAPPVVRRERTGLPPRCAYTGSVCLRVSPSVNHPCRLKTIKDWVAKLKLEEE